MQTRKNDNDGGREFSSLPRDAQHASQPLLRIQGRSVLFALDDIMDKMCIRDDRAAMARRAGMVRSV
ncbi:hypothetical protein XH99_14305 [Bradyrhizobium nanningense]|uniref:Uncharacterized protein n=1 Tax=Bradyrhizobium nanningense TaxID=1325118 RepID=A0A4Q0S4U6_9BRAD|nr:hypothetical protein XH99_14305 [Bradyrhizobium nanningense]